MRILMVSDVSFPRVNGVSTSIQTFRRSLAELGHESVLVAPDYAEGGGPRVTAAGPDERTVPAVDADGLECVRVRARPVPRDPEDRLMRHGDVVALADRLAARRFDVLHVHTPFVAHYAGIALARRLGLPVVETYHTFFEEYLHHYVPLLPRALTRYAARAFTRSQCRQVDALVVPSGQMLATLRGYGVATRAEVLPTGIDLARFAGGDGAAFRRAHGIPPDRPVLVHISRVAHEKNIDFVLRAVAQVRREVPDVLLVIAGEGPAVPHVRRLARELGLESHVLFVGYLDRGTTLLDCYRAGDAFVFASRTETQGLVLLEALALGVPVVSTAVMGTADVLRDARGARVAPDDETGFARACVEVLRDPELRGRLAANAPRDSQAWSAVAMAERLAQLYAELAAARGRVVDDPPGAAVPAE
ncbi:MAG: glycosyltransferase [Steroidobacteraceae bacterium]|nr:glycosyltransferase [Steroidobacteraceae bacterium]